MSKYNKTVLTNAGLDLAIKAARGKTKFTITKTATSADNLADKKIDELQELTELPNIVQYGQIVDVADSTQDKNVVIGVGLYFNNQDLTQSYDLNTIALYAKEEGSDTEVLYGLTTAVEPETMPDYQDEVLFKFNLTMYVVVGRTDNVTVKVVEDGVVTDKKLEERLQVFATKADLDILQSLINKDIRDLAALNAADGNNIYNTTINLDTYSKVGINKFLGCKLQSSGQMTGFKQETEKLYGWILNIPKWNGATEFQQIVYICNYGDGTLIYLRSHVDNSGKTKEDFEKLTTDKDLSNIHTIANPIEVEDKTNPDSLNEPGIYFTKNGFDFAKNDVPDGYRSDGKSYLAVLEGDNPDNGINYYQQFLFQATKFNFVCWYRAGYKYGSGAYYTVSFVNLKDIFGKLKQICLNGGAAISPDDNGVANLNVVTKVDGIAPDKDGNVPTDHYTKAEIDKRVTDINGHIDTIEKREITHVCDDYDTGLEYSKNHKDVFVAVTGN